MRPEVLYHPKSNAFANHSLTVTEGWIVRSRVWMHAGGGKRLSGIRIGRDGLIPFLQLFLVIFRPSPQDVVVNIGPKLLQFIAEGIESHLGSPIGEARRCTAIRSRIVTVSYTHLDVYKRQAPRASMARLSFSQTSMNFEKSWPKALWSKAQWITPSACAAPLRRLSASSRPVSYTHLDVYKRQVSEVRPAVRSRCRRRRLHHAGTA